MIPLEIPAWNVSHYKIELKLLSGPKKSMQNPFNGILIKIPSSSWKAILELFQCGNGGGIAGNLG